LTPLEAFALERGGQPDVTLANIPLCSIAHCFFTDSETGRYPRQYPWLVQARSLLAHEESRSGPIAGPVTRELRLQIVRIERAPRDPAMDARSMAHRDAATSELAFKRSVAPDSARLARISRETPRTSAPALETRIARAPECGRSA
jgi:hypothetical protein